MRLQEALDGWLLDVEARGRTPRTLAWYRETLNHFIRHSQESGVDQIEGLTAGHLRSYALSLGHLSPDTRHNRITAIKVFSRWLWSEELLSSDPFVRVKRPTKGLQTANRALSPDQLRAILGQYDPKDLYEARDACIVRLVLDTGLRRGEVCGATLEDLDREQGFLWVLGKGRRRRRVPLSPTVRSHLWKYLSKGRPKDCLSPYLFVSRTGGQVNGNHLGKTFHQKALQAGVRARFHDLRHTAATWALQANMPKERVSRLLGHANDSITSIYEHLAFEDVQAAHAQASPLARLGR